MIMYPPESDVFAHAAEDLREQRRVLRVEEVAVEGVLAERRVHQQALRVISLTHAYQQTTIAHQHVHVGVVALRVRVTDLTHLLQRLHGHGRVGDVFEHLVALLQLVALRGVLAQRLLALWVSDSLPRPPSSSGRTARRPACATAHSTPLPLPPAGPPHCPPPSRAAGV